MATVSKSKASRRSFVKAAVAAPLAAVAAEAQGESIPENFPELAKVQSKVENVPLCSPAFAPVELFLATITSNADCRATLATLDRGEAERFVESFNRASEGSGAHADIARLLVGPQGPSVEVFAALTTFDDGRPAEVNSVAAHPSTPEGFCCTWNHLSKRHKHASRARVVRGVATFGDPSPLAGYPAGVQAAYAKAKTDDARARVLLAWDTGLRASDVAAMDLHAIHQSGVAIHCGQPLHLSPQTVEAVSIAVRSIRKEVRA